MSLCLNISDCRISAMINMHEACCHATSDQECDQLLYRSKHKHSRNVDRVLKSFQTASSVNQSSVLFIIFMSESNASI